MRLEWSLENFTLEKSEIFDRLQPMARRHEMQMRLHFASVKKRIALFVTKENHCLYDLLARHEAGDLPVEIPLIIANHDTLRPAADRFGIPFHHFPITKDNKLEQEAAQIALLKKEPNKLSYGSDGNGTASHLGMEILKAKANVQLTHIPYRGSTPMITDLLGGTLMVGVTGLPAVQQHLKAGKLKMIAITTPQRAPGAPDYKTVAEQGFANFNAAPWAGFFAPKGTPKPVVDKLALDLADALKQADVAQKMNELGSTVVGNKPEEFRQFVSRQIEMWAEGVKISGATVD